MFDAEAYKKRVKWFSDARFGMFIHWGLYSIPARGEWVASYERIAKEDYHKYFEQFNPAAFNPAEWARLCKKAGMKYAVLTAKHHDGFCLFDSGYTGFKSTNTSLGRDIVAEYLDAFRKEGIKTGLYYSIIDWRHDGFPHFGDRQHPMRDNPAFKGKKHDFNNYLDYMHAQVRELCTNYGKIDVLWFDFSYGEMTGEKWRATELVKMVRGLQPDIILNNRLEASGEGFGSLATDNPTEYSGDFVSPEQIIPPNGLFRQNGEPLLWEACITLNNHWGYCHGDRHYKPAGMVIKKLVECVSKNGNLLLNVGPDANGRIAEEAVRILEDVGRWTAKNGEAVYGCGASFMEKPEYGRITRNGSKIYYHVMDNPIGFIPLTGLKKEEITAVRLLETGAELKIEDNWICGNYPETAFVSLGESPLLLDESDTVLEVTVKE